MSRPRPTAPPLARARPHRPQDNLSHLLECRPDAQALADKNIGVQEASRVAASLHGKKKQLELAMTRDRVEHLLASRPDADTMLASNLIKQPEMADALKGSTANLGRSFMKVGARETKDSRRSPRCKPSSHTH